MSRIQSAFEKGERKLLSIYCTAGFPNGDSTSEVILALQRHGADFIELGIPYSDPLADGPVIQQSSAMAIANGMTLQRLLDDLEELKEQVKIPVILMGYLNSLLQYGFEKFCAAASAAGVSGLIIPDMPLVEYERRYKNVLLQYDLDFSFLVSPETPESRVRQLDAASSGFLYAVSSSSITGSGVDANSVEGYLQRLRQMQLQNRIMVGFGISDRASFESATRYADGGIIGTAYIRAIKEATDIDAATKEFIHGIVGEKK